MFHPMTYWLTSASWSRLMLNCPRKNIIRALLWTSAASTDSSGCFCRWIIKISLAVCSLQMADGPPSLRTTPGRRQNRRHMERFRSVHQCLEAEKMADIKEASLCSNNISSWIRIWEHDSCESRTDGSGRILLRDMNSFLLKKKQVCFQKCKETKLKTIYQNECLQKRS